MPTDYNVALFFHILGVVILFAALSLEIATMLAMRQSRSVEQVRALAWAHKLLAFMFPTGVMLILAGGLYMWHREWEAGEEWTVVAFITFIFAAVLGFAFNARHGAKIVESSVKALNGPITAELKGLILAPRYWTAVCGTSGFAVGIIYLMTVKPGWIGSVLTVLIGGAIGASLGASATRGGVPDVSAGACVSGE